MCVGIDTLELINTTDLGHYLARCSESWLLKLQSFNLLELQDSEINPSFFWVQSD